MAEIRESTESKELVKESHSEEISSGPSSEVQEQRSSELEQESNDSFEDYESESQSEDTFEGDDVDSSESTEEIEREQPLVAETERNANDINENNTLNDNSEQSEPLEIGDDAEDGSSEGLDDAPIEDNSENEEPLNIDEAPEEKTEALDDPGKSEDATDEEKEPPEQELKTDDEDVAEDSDEDEAGDNEKDNNEPLNIDEDNPSEANKPNDINDGENRDISDNDDAKTLQFGDGEMEQDNPEDSDLKRAQDDLDFAQNQMEEYKKAVNSGEIEYDPEVEQQLQDSIDYSNDHLNDVQNGQAYSYDKPSDYWASPEGREIAGEIYGTATGMAVDSIGEKLGADIPSGNNPVKEAGKSSGKFYGKNFGYKHIGKAADTSKDLMQGVHRQYDTPGDKYKQSHFMRNADGVPITAGEGRSIAFNDERSKGDANLSKSPEGTKEKLNEKSTANLLEGSEDLYGVDRTESNNLSPEGLRNDLSRMRNEQFAQEDYINSAYPNDGESRRIINNRIADQYDGIVDKYSGTLDDFKNQRDSLKTELDNYKGDNQVYINSLRDRIDRLDNDINSYETNLNYAKSVANSFRETPKTEFSSINGKEFTESYNGMISKQHTGDCGVCSYSNSKGQITGETPNEQKEFQSMKDNKNLLSPDGATNERTICKQCAADGLEGKTIVKPTAEQIHDIVKNGDSCMIALNSDHLKSGEKIRKGGANHFVNVVGSEYDSQGKPIGFWINNSNRCTGTNKVYLSNDRFDAIVKKTGGIFSGDPVTATSIRRNS